MKLYRNNQNSKLYTIEHLILDIKFTNRNENTGIYAYPFNFNGDVIKFLNRDHNKCNQFVVDNFTQVCEL